MNTFVFGITNLLRQFIRFWWIVALSLAVGLGAAAVAVKMADPVFVSRARLAETVRMRLPESSMFTEDAQSFIGTQTELLQSARLRELALERLRMMDNATAVPRGSDGEPLPVDLEVSASAKSAVYTLEARSAHPAYTQAFLDSLMIVYLEYKKEAVKFVSNESLGSLSDLVQRAQRDLQVAQEKVREFRRTNNVTILEQEAKFADGYLLHLSTRLVDLRIEYALVENAIQNAGKSASNPRKANTDGPGGRYFTSGSLPGDLASVRPSDFNNTQQLTSYRASLGQAIEHLQQLREEWLAKQVTEGIPVIEAYERLRLQAERAQSNMDRLAALLENVHTSRNIDQQTLSILEHASSPMRSYAKEIGISIWFAGGGLCLGLLAVLLIWIFKGRSNSPQ